MVGIFVLCFSVTAWATPPVNADARGVAIRGYDPVAYFTMGKAVQGSQEFAYQWNGATWWFANQDDLEHFKKEPEKYAPRYGGY
jgi:YHS domain-containing protein